MRLRFNRVRYTDAIRPKVWRRIYCTMVSTDRLSSQGGAARMDRMMAYSSPVLNCARPYPKLQSASALVTMDTITSLDSIPQRTLRSRQSSSKNASLDASPRGLVVIETSTTRSVSGIARPLSWRITLSRRCSCTTWYLSRSGIPNADTSALCAGISCTRVS